MSAGITVTFDPRSRTNRLVNVTAAAVAAWLVGALVVAPLGVQWTGADSGIGGVLTAYRASARDGALILTALGVVVWACRALGSRRLARTVEPATAESLGAIRIWIATILLASILWEDLPSSAWLPRGMMDTDRHWLMGVLHALPIGFDALLADHAALVLLETATIAALGMAAIGLCTRWAVPAGALLYLLAASILRGYSWSYHTGLIPLYALLLLSFTPCGDALSLDRWRRARRGEALPEPDRPRLRYGIGRYLVWMAIAIPYLLAGLSKLRNTGPLWWVSENMKQMLVGTVVEPLHFGFETTFHLLRGPDWIFGLLGLAALASELLFVLALVNRVARLILPALTAAMHVGILLVQNILFPDLIAIQAVFYDWRPLLQRLRSGVPRFVRGSAIEPITAPVRRSAGPAVNSAFADMEPSARSVVTRRQALVARGFVVLCFLAWATRTEKFPITAMQMFSRPPRLGP